MARVARLAGALLAETEGTFYLVGDLKQPCDFVTAGFESPGSIEARERPFVRLKPIRPISLTAPVLTVDCEGEPFAQLLHDRFVIERNGSVSERLWRLVAQDRMAVEASWLAQIPQPIWQVVRDAVLKCS